MKFGKLFLYAVLTGILAGIVTLITWQINGFIVTGKNSPLTYICFASWATYFLVGANPKGALRSFTSMIAGIIAAALIFVLSLLFGFTPWYAVPLAVVILVIPMCLCEKVTIFNSVPSVFLGTALFFSLSAAGAIPSFDFKGYALAGLAELFYVAIGFIAGFITIQINVMCANIGKKEVASESSNKQ